MSDTKTMALVPINDIERMGAAIAKSGLFGMKTQDQAVALMLIAQAEGLHPAVAARDYHVIQGRPALKADAMMARFQAAGGKVRWNELTEAKVSATFSHPAGGEAKRIGLAVKDNWLKFPRAMLRSRVVSEGIRTVYPGCVVGTYTPEEVQDFDDAPQRRPPIDITPPPPGVIEPPVDNDAQPYAFYVPGRADPYSRHVDFTEWARAYAAMRGKIATNKKLSVEARQEKLAALEAANAEELAVMDDEQRIEFTQYMNEASNG
jgi:hypothetical protein